MADAAFDATYYETFYRDYVRQNPPKKLRFYARMVGRHLPPGVPRRIHDIGCGFGDFLAMLGPSWGLCGSDVSEYAIAEAAKRHPRACFQTAAATDRAPFPGQFGVVTALDVLEHVAALDAVAASVGEQLVPRGLFVFVVPVYDGLSGPVIRWLDRDPTHVHKWPRRRWLQWAATHFEVVDWMGLVRYLALGVYYVHLVTRALRNHTPAMIVICRKDAQGPTPGSPGEEPKG